jgi:DNA-binding transcriptional MerR regulator
MRSGELARRAGVSADTIRHYERLGLLKAPARNRNGYRNYSPDALGRVRLIRRSLAVGFSLRELAAILQLRDRGGVPCKAVFASAKSKLEKLDLEIAALKAMRRDLRRILDDWAARLAHAGSGKPAGLLENLPEGVEKHANASHRTFGRAMRQRRSNTRASASGKPAL